MRAEIQIDDLELLYQGRLTDLRRRRLDEVAVRQLPAVLDRLLAPLDDGRLVIVRRVVSNVKLSALDGEQAWAERWGAAIAADLRQQVAAARTAGAAGDEDADAVVFDGPVTLLARYAVDALDGRLARWYWQAEAGALEAAARALAELPGSDGISHPYATAPAPPASPSAVQALEWAFLAAGAALPELIASLGERAPAALAPLPRDLAASLLAGLAPPGARVGSAIAIESLAPFAGAVRNWPAPEPADPRNGVLLAAHAIAERPSLRRATGLAEAVVRALAHRALAVTAAGPAGPARKRLTRPPPTLSVVPRAPVAPSTRDELATGPVAAAHATDFLRERATEPEVPRPEGLAWSGAQPTRFAGLFFLLGPLRRLGMPDAVLDEPALDTDPGFGPVLYRLACRLAPDAWNDVAALTLLGADEPLAARAPLDDERRAALVHVEQRMADAALALAAAPRSDDDQDLEARALLVPPPLEPAGWLDALCAQTALLLVGTLRAHIGSHLPAGELLDRVVLRDGLLLRTPTHIDVRLAADSVDLGVRRAALDADPGWVPFLGRVVGFHYV